MSNFFCNYWEYPLILLSIAGIVVWRYVSFATIIRQIPIIGDIYRKIDVLNFCSAMNIMMSEKINLLDCLKALARAYPTVGFVVEKLQQGSSFSNAIKITELFSDYEISIIETAETSGELSAAFHSIELITRSSIERQLKTIISMMPTLVIVFVGLLLVAIVCSLLLPLYSSIDISM